MSYLAANGMSNKGFQEKPFVSNGIPCLIDGVDILDTLCPVSKKTGLRENVLTLIRKLASDPAKQVLLYQCLQELPVDNSQSGLSEEDKFEVVPQRLQVGTPAEQEELLNMWSSIVDHQIDSLKAQQAAQVAEKAVSQSDTISFNENGE